MKVLRNLSKSGSNSSVTRSIRPSEMIRRPSAICAVMSESVRPQKPPERRDSVCSMASDGSELDGTQLIDNDMSKTFGAQGTTRNQSVYNAQDGSRSKPSNFFTFTATAGGMASDMRKEAKSHEKPPPLENATTTERIMSSFTSDGSYSTDQMTGKAREKIGAELMRAIFGDHSSKVLRPKHHRLPSVLKQIFGQQDKGSRRFSGGVNGGIARATAVGPLRPPKNPTTFSMCIFRLRQACGSFMAKTRSQAFFIIITLYALFGPDTVQWLARSDQDEIFLIINTVVFGLFVLEIFLCAFGLRGWLFSVPAALDIIALLSFTSDTLLLQVNIFQSEDGERTTRLARSSRMTRLVRVARVVRVTKLVPRLIEFLGGHSNNLAKHVLRRRLWRLFLFLDTGKTGTISSLDLKVVYLIMISECPYLWGTASKIDLLNKDLPWFTSDVKMQDLSSEYTFLDFASVLQSLSIGKLMYNFHLQEIEKGDSVWSLTRKVSDGSALKICIGILMIFIFLTFLDTAIPNDSYRQGLAFLDSFVTKAYRRLPSLDVGLICDQIGCYMEDHKVMLLFLVNRTYIPNPGADCGPGILRSVLDPLKRIDEIVTRSKKRDSEVLLVCWPDEQCSMDNGNSAVLLDAEQEWRDDAKFSVILTSTILVLILIFILLFNRVVSRFSRTLLKPLRSLVDDMHAMCSLDLVEIDVDAMDNNPKEPKVADEMQHLQRAFITMRTAVRSWGKYVPPAIVQRLMTSGFEATIGVVRVQATILFVDIDDFEDVCHGLSPKDTLAVLSTVLGKVADAIQEDKGILLEFIGDEVLAVFNVPTVINHHTYHATNCAVAIHEAVEKMPSTMVQDGRSIAVRCRTGVHTAQILAGNVGSKRRMKFGLLGDGVNLTARLKTLNSRYKTQTIVSDKVITADLIDEKFVWRPLEKVAVKGRKEATVVYEVLGWKESDGMEEFARLAQLHIEAFNLYHKREFSEAAKLCEQVRSLFEVVGRPDEPSRQLLKKCNNFMAEPPPPEWDGVERLQKKTFEVPKDEPQDGKPIDADQDTKRDENQVFDDIVKEFAEEALNDTAASSVVRSLPSHTIPVALDESSPRLQSRTMDGRRLDLPSCWRHLLQLPHDSRVRLACPSHGGTAQECCGIAGVPRVSQSGSSSFCGPCNAYSMPAIVVLPGPEARVEPEPEVHCISKNQVSMIHASQVSIM